MCDRGVALAGRSLLHGRPNSIIGRYDRPAVRPVEVSMARIRVEMGNDQVWLSRREEAIVRSALTAPQWA